MEHFKKTIIPYNFKKTIIAILREIREDIVAVRQEKDASERHFQRTGKNSCK